MINFTKHKNKYLTISGILVAISFLAVVVFGFNLGIDLAGGSTLEVDYEERPSLEEVKSSLDTLELTNYEVREIGSSSILIRTTETGEDIYGEMMSVLEGAEEKYFESIGPAVGEELKRTTIIAMVLASLLVIIYIAFAFSGASGPVSSWQYGATATAVAFLHDVLLIVGIFAIMGHFWGVQFTIPIAVALLTTLGYSLNDTVVIFDRIRENIYKKGGKFEEVVNKSLNQTLTRSINTSLTTLLVLLAILFFGGESLFYFILALVMGVVFGTYSSIFLASSLLLVWKEGFDKNSN
jgi:preprotein translocase subunit SecF